MTAFRAVHEELTLRFGPEAALARHELFFHAATPRGWRPRWAQALRAVAAAIRDLWWLYGAIGPRRALRAGEVAAVATLPGPSGWRTLARARATMAVPAAALLHPRMGRSVEDGASVVWLLRPSLSALLTRPSFGVAGRAAQVRGSRRISAVAVAATVWRRGLWRSAWRRSLAAAPGALLLHNDFDMMNAAAVGLGWPTICLQHGVPTDEFFPARADWQVVWGLTSEQAYRDAGVPAERLVVDALGRDEAAIEGDAIEGEDEPPSGLVLLSQTHALILGPEARRALVDFATAAARNPGLRILLHPQEARGRAPYPALPGASIERPPHPALTVGGEAGALVVGLCSTALFDALIAGHFVVGLEYPPLQLEAAAENRAARLVASPPERVVDGGAAVALLERLQADPQVRAAHRRRLNDWRRNSFSPAKGGFKALLAQIAAA